MKQVVLYDVDSRLPNLALMKLSRFYKDKGYSVALSNRPQSIPGNLYFASVVFNSPKSLYYVNRLRKLYDDKINIGGSGIDLKAVLPHEIDRCFPDYSLYGHTHYALGFLTRGCNKRCKFCVVPNKEGSLISDYSTFDDFVPGNQRNVMLLDNNVLASPNSQDILREIIKRKLNINFNQTLDIQYLNDDNYDLLKRVNSVNSRFTKRMIYFSCNTEKQTDWFYKKSDYLHGFGKNQVTVVIMFGYNTSLSEDYTILKMTKDLGVIPFVQRYQPITGVPPRVPTDFFDMDLDEIAEFRFRTNGRNGEKFLRYVNERYFDEFGRYYLPILKAIYRYNNKPRLQYYLERPHLLTEKMYKKYIDVSPNPNAPFALHEY